MGLDKDEDHDKEVLNLIIPSLSCAPNVNDWALNDKIRSDVLAFAKSKPTPQTLQQKLSAMWNMLDKQSQNNLKNTAKSLYKDRNRLTEKDIAGYAAALGIPAALLSYKIYIK